MAEISNKTIAGLLVALIVISLVSLFFTMTKLSGPGATGYVSSTGIGITNVTVLETTYINVTDNFIDLGLLEPGMMNNSDNRNDFFHVKNLGSVNINISVYDNSTGLFTGTGCSTLPNSCYQAKGVAAQTSGDVMGVYTNIPASVVSALGVCFNVPFIDGGDLCTIGVQATVPVDEPAGYKQSVATIVAERA